MLQEMTETLIYELKNGKKDSNKTNKITSEKNGRARHIQLVFDGARDAIKNIKDPKQKALHIETLERGLQKLLSLSNGNVSLDALESQKSLSNILADIKSTIAQISSIQNLPPEAAVIRGETITVVNDSIAKTEAVQRATLDFVANNYAKLEVVKNELENPSIPIDTILIKMTEISNNAIVLKSEADKLDINVTLIKIGELTAQSNALQTKYSLQVAGLEAKIAEARIRLAQAENDRWYWLLLGPFGIAGVIAAAVIISNVTNEVNDLANAINADINKLNQIRNFSNAVNSFSTLFNELFKEIGFLKNDIDFVIGQISNIIQNLTNPTVERSIIALYVIATLETFKQLEADAV
jgi:hypothetical protein